jgi:hypothetical protein
MCGRFETLTRSEAEGAARAILARTPYNYAPDWITEDASILTAAASCSPNARSKSENLTLPLG